MGKTARRWLSRVAYVAVVLAFFEGTARWLLGSDERVTRFGSSVDEPSWRLRWVRRHATGEPLRFRFDVPHPTRGWALRPDLRNEPAFEGKLLNTNSKGLRGRAEPILSTPPKPPEKLRILLFGDSFTFGEGVSDGETYGHYLQELLPRTEVLNFGVHGYGHDQILIYLREAGESYRADLIVLGYVTDDATRNLLGFRDFAKPRFVVDGDRLRLLGSPVPTPQEVLAAERYRSRFVDLVTMVSQQLDWRFGGRKEDMFAVTRRLLREFFDTVRAYGAEPLLVDLPVWHELDNRDPAPTSREILVSQLCRENRVPYLGLRPLFVQERQSGVAMEPTEHWGPGEHRIAAQGLAAYLARQGFLQRRPQPAQAARADSGTTAPSD